MGLGGCRFSPRAIRSLERDRQPYSWPYPGWWPYRAHSAVVGSKWIVSRMLYQPLIEEVLTAWISREVAIILDGCFIRDKPPSEPQALRDTVAAVLRLVGREQVTSPTDSAALFLAEMGGIDQQEWRPVRRDTKNTMREIITVCRGSLNVSMSRVGEVFKEAVRRNGAGLIVVHNDPKFKTELHPRPVLVFRIVLGPYSPSHSSPTPNNELLL